MKNKNITALIKIIGYPEEERTINNQKIYRWKRSLSAPDISISSNSASYSISSAVFGSGVNAIATAAGGGISTGTAAVSNFSAQTQGIIEYRCNITAETDNQNRITGIIYDGNYGGCRPYIKKLDAAFVELATPCEIKPTTSLDDKTKIYGYDFGDPNLKNKPNLDNSMLFWKQNEKICKRLANALHQSCVLYNPHLCKRRKHIINWK